MGLWGFLVLIFFIMQGEGCQGMTALSLTGASDDYQPLLVKHHKKKKHHKKPHKKHHKKKKSKRHKQKLYSAKKIEQMLKNDGKDGRCNRLNCTSNLEIAKSCLNTRPDRRKNKNCFRAFCAYGCNDEDYANKPDVYAFCNKTCSSKRYRQYLKHPDQR